MPLPRGLRPIVIARIAFALLLLAAVLYVGFFANWRPHSVDDAKERLSAAGIFAPLLTILFQAIGVVLFVPGFLLILVTALLFGLKSIWISLIGQTLGSMACFFIARFIGQDAARTVFGTRILAIERLLSRHGFRTLILLRFLSLIPLPILAYAPGLVRMRLRDVCVATLIGEAPFVVVLGVFGHTLAGVRHPYDLLAPAFLGPAALLLALITLPATITLLVMRHQRRKRRLTPPNGPDVMAPPPRPYEAPRLGEKRE